MKIPINWLKNYIDFKHSNEEFGDIMTRLEFMQDGPIKVIKDESVIDLEVRQNRPDVLSILGVAQEYAAFIHEKVKYPVAWENISLPWNTPSTILNVQAENVVKRFTAVKIENVRVKESPDHIKKYLEAYGIPAINNIVDITNFVMLEYGIPMHAFDLDKLPNIEGKALLTLRMGKTGESFTTWQGIEIKSTKNDLVVSDSNNKLVSIGAIIGEKNSGISNNTKNIILEAANYDHAYIRKTALRHNLITESSTRHSKILPSDLVANAIRRSIHLILDLAGGEVKEIEDYYRNKQGDISIDFDLNEIKRLGGVELNKNIVVNLLNRLGFETQEKAENIILVKVPKWRTDVLQEADLVEEVLRLYGYENIPLTSIDSAPPENSTPPYLILEDKIRNILVSLGLDEHITEPIVKFKNLENQIKLENPLNKEKDGLRTTIRQTLKPVIELYKKAGREKVALFEVGKVYYTLGKEIIEERRVETLYFAHSFEKVKGDLLEILNRLGLLNIKEAENKDVLEYTIDHDKVAVLGKEGFKLLTENITKKIVITKIPNITFNLGLYQEIEEYISLTMDKNQPLGKISEIFSEESEYIARIELKETYKGKQISKNKKSVTFKITFEDPKNKLDKKIIEDVKNKAIQKLEKQFGVKLRK